MRHLFLFDVDGVLVQPNGYLRALQDTVAHFTSLMGVGEHAPTAGEVHAFEAYGITSEWDSAPTCIAALLVERLRRTPELVPPARWADALEHLGGAPMDLPHPDFAALAARVGAGLSGGVETSHAARAVLREAGADLAPDQRAALDALLEELLGDTHDFAGTPVTRHFQNLTIGDEGVAQTYGVEPAFTSRPYLREYDVALLGEGTREALLEAAAAGRIHPVVYTARPSLPPADSGAPARGYSPEAELARELVGLEAWPLIAFGSLRWLALETGEMAARLVKPSPVQALAAVGVAATGQEAASLRAALALARSGDLRAPLTEIGGATVHVFEDTATGAGAVGDAVSLLAAAGLPVTWRPYGITSPTGPKAEAMAARAIPTYRTVDDAVAEALQAVSQTAP
jgi:hypothetical protein